MRVVESSWYSRREATMTTLQSYAENFGWIADSSQLNQYDYCYFNTIRGISQQWWRFMTAPNNTVGSLVISEGLPGYDLLVMAEKKYGKCNIKSILQDQLWAYIFFRHRDANEHPLIKANLWYEWNGKAAIALYGLRDLIGEDSMNTALRDFRNEFAFRSEPPFAGSRDLLRCLKKHVPDSLQYYLSDTWEKVCLYDNSLRKAQVTPSGKPGEYKVTLDVEVKKFVVDEKGNDINVNQFNDFIDIGIFGPETVNAQGRREQHPLYLVKQKLKAGEHSITVIVKGKPASAGIDPLAKLIDRNPGDNTVGL
jgi:hypothetical protein